MGRRSKELLSFFYYVEVLNKVLGYAKMRSVTSEMYKGKSLINFSPAAFIIPTFSLKLYFSPLLIVIHTYSVKWIILGQRVLTFCVWDFSQAFPYVSRFHYWGFLCVFRIGILLQGKCISTLFLRQFYKIHASFTSSW